MGKGRGRRARTRRRGVLYRPLCFLVAAAAILFSISVFFKMLHIEVQGAGLYSSAEVVEASGLETGKNLLLVRKSQAEAAILAAMPYIKSVEIRRRLPATLEITVVESRAVAYVTEGGGCWLLDSDGKVLEKATLEAAEGLIHVTGLTPEKQTAGQSLAVLEEDAARKEFLVAVLRILTEKEMNGKVREMDVSNVSNLRFDYAERFTVKLGTMENLENKLTMIGTVAAQKGETERGTIDMSYPDNGAHFIPE